MKMELSINKKVWQYMLLITLFLVSVISFLFYIKPVFIALIIGIVITVLLNEVYGIFFKLTKNYSVKKRRAIAVIGIVVVVSIVSVVAIGGVFLIGDTLSGKNNTNDILDSWEDFNNQFNDSAEDLAEEISMLNIPISENTLDGIETAELEMDSRPIKKIQNESNSSGMFGFNMTRSEVIQSIFLSSSGFLSMTKETISMAMAILFNVFLIVPIMVGYYFKEKGQIRKKIIVYVPNKYKTILDKTIKDVTNDMSNYAVTKILEVIIITFLYCAGFYAIGIPHWLFIGIMMGMFSIVPYIGFIIPTIITIVYTYTIGTGVLIATIGVIIVIQLFDYFYLLPGMVMKTIKIRSFTAIVLTLAGLKLFGMFGLIFAVPMYILCKIILVAAYKMLVEMYPDPVDLDEMMAEEA